MVLQNYMTSLRHYISATTVRMASKPVRVVNLQGHVTKIKLYFHYFSVYGHQTWQVGGLFPYCYMTLRQVVSLDHVAI